MEHQQIYLQRPCGVRKLLRIMLILAGICAASRDVYNYVARYLSKPINSFTKLNYPNELYLPQIVVCNSNQFRITETQHDLYPMITAAFETLTDRDKFDINNYTHLIDRAINRTGRHEAYIYRQLVAHKLQDIVLKCTTWTGENCNRNFTEQIYDYGVCYRLNGSKWPPVTRPGSSQSLTIFLNLESYQHMQGPAQFLNSLRVAILHKRQFPYVTARGFDIPPGYMSIVALRYNQYIRVLETDGGSCIEKKELDHFEEAFYSYDTCQLNLALVESQNRCGCKPFYATEKMNSSFCDLYQHFNCVIWNEFGLQNTPKCNHTCDNVEYQISLSTSKIPPSIWSSIITRQNAQKIYNTFNASMESAARTDTSRVKRLKSLTDGITDVMDDIQSLGMEPSKTQDIITDAKKAFEKTFAPACYKRMLKEYKDIFQKLEERWPLDPKMLCTDSRLSPVRQRIQSPTDEEISALINRLISNEDRLWDSVHMDQLFEWPSNLNNSHQLFKFHIGNVLRNLREVSNHFRNPWCLAKPIAFPAYWTINEQIKKYYIRNITLKEWVDRFPGDTGVEYQSMYAAEYLLAYQGAVSQIEITMDRSDNYSQIVNQTYFWQYFGIYLLYKENLYNDTICNMENGTYIDARQPVNTFLSQNLPSCQGNPYFNLKDFYTDALACAKGDFLANLEHMKKKVESTATKYRQYSDQLQQFLTDYGRRWEFGEQFFMNNIVGLKIFYADLNQQIINEEMAYNVSTLFADIGGSLGLFIGASIISLFEFFDIVLCEMIFFRLIKRRNEQPEPTQNMDVKHVRL